MAGLRDDLRRQQVELSMNDKISLEDDARAHLNHAKDWEQLLNEIRNIPRFKDFLQPRKCADIMSDLPKEGPIVIINIHPDRCDALALMAGAVEPQHIPLPHFSYKEAERLANGLQDYLLSLGVRLGHPLKPFNSPPSDVDFSLVLKVLWSDVVSPILKALEFSVRLSLFSAMVYPQESIGTRVWSEAASYLVVPNQSSCLSSNPCGRHLREGKRRSWTLLIRICCLVIYPDGRLSQHEQNYP